MSFYLATFLGAFLYFQVQLIVGKRLLPWFGGAPMVWTTCMLFFQTVLLLGYAYVHLTSARLRLKAQTILQHSLLWIAAAALVSLTASRGSPVNPGEEWKPASGDHPVASILLLLGAGVGLPAFVLSTTSPLLQAWFARIHRERSPYALYSLSNLGSLMALVTYPVLVEPGLTLKSQATAWTIAYVAFCVACSACALAARQAGLPPALEGAIQTPVSSAPHGRQKAAVGPELGPELGPRPRIESGPGPMRRILWLALSACGSVMLLAATNQMCQEVAVVPFLWVFPLVLYLGTFIVCFRREKKYSRGLWTIALVVASALACVSLSRGPTLGIWMEIGSTAFSLLAACMVCHGELALSRPMPRHLTSFYLTIALGGALGGAFVGLLAPAAFKGFWEYPLGLWAAGFLLAVMAWRDTSSWVYHTRPWFPYAALTGLLLALLGIQMVVRSEGDKPVPGATLVGTAVTTALGIFLVFWKRRSREKRARPATMLGLAGAGLLVLGMVFTAMELKADRGAVYRSRSFHGALTVIEKSPGDPSSHALELMHGRVIHGRQFLDPLKRRLPTTYYGPTSGIGLAILHHPRRASASPGLRIGAVGLGAGTLASYARPGDTIRFYEINPDVLRLSRKPLSLFTNLEDCQGKVEVEIGDARLSLERELRENRPQDFDVLAIDAFSGDAVPVHLLTAEAFQIYRAHLRMPGGVLAFHISNHFLDLAPVVRALAEHFHMQGIRIESGASEALCTPSTWVLLGADRNVLDLPEIRRGSTPLELTPPARLWTDQFSNPLAAVRGLWRP